MDIWISWLVKLRYRVNAMSRLHASVSDTTREWYSSGVQVALLTSASGTTREHKISQEL